MELSELIARAPWREAVTYRDTWPHEYVLLQKDDQRELTRIHRWTRTEGVRTLEGGVRKLQTRWPGLEFG